MQRLNHDCRPNAHYYFDGLHLVQHTRALRSIAPGEEITISYINPLQVRSARRETLQRTWGFHCTCSLCGRSEEESEVSDMQTEIILHLIQQVERPGQHAAVLLPMVEEMLRLYEVEELHGQITEPNMLAAIVLNRAGDEWAAMKYARLAIEEGNVYCGPRDPQVGEMRKILRDPRGHWSWKARPSS